jgi:penicillin-binding protein 1A
MKWSIKILKFGFWSLLVGAVAGAIALAAAYFYLEPELPDTASLRNVALQVPLRVYSRERKLIAEYGEKRRIPLSYDEVPERMVQAFLAAEDNRFLQRTIASSSTRGSIIRGCCGRPCSC